MREIRQDRLPQHAVGELHFERPKRANRGFDAFAQMARQFNGQLFGQAAWNIQSDNRFDSIRLEIPTAVVAVCRERR